MSLTTNLKKQTNLVYVLFLSLDGTLGGFFQGSDAEGAMDPFFRNSMLFRKKTTFGSMLEPQRAKAGTVRPVWFFKMDLDLSLLNMRSELTDWQSVTVSKSHFIPICLRLVFISGAVWLRRIRRAD